MDDELVHKGQFKTKIKYYDDKVNTNFYENKMPKDGVHCVWFSTMSIDSVFKIDEHFYQKIFLEKCDYVVKENNLVILLMKTFKFFLMSLMKRFLIMTLF